MLNMLAPLYDAGYNIDDVLFVNYNDAMDIIGRSTHFNQYNKRKAKYPQHIMRINGVPHISEDYLLKLIAFHTATNHLITIKQKEVSDDARK